MLEGEISEMNLVPRLVELWREQFTGAIRFENDGIIKIVYFKGGDILSASTNDRSDSIDEILMRAGKVSREHVKQALAKRKENETLGDALLNLGFITRKELTWSRRVQVVGVIRSIVAWTQGSFTIVADYLPKRDEGTLFALPQVLVELIVTEQDRARFERALDGGNAVFAKSADFDDVWRKLGLNEDAESIVSEIDGSKSATEIATASGSDTFNVYKLLDALATLGILRRAGKPQATPEVSFADEFAAAGVADAADLWNEPAAAAPSPSEPAAYTAPEFELDDDLATSAAGPTLEIPAMSFDEPALPPAEPSVVADAEDFASAGSTPPAPVPAAKLPAWDVAPRDPVAVPIPARIEPPAEAAEEQWGFDEAQIETARRASMPGAVASSSAATAAAARSPREPKRRREGSRYGLLIVLFVVALLGVAGYYGFLWWQGRQAPQEDLLVRRPEPVRPATTTAAPVAVVTEGTAAVATDTTGSNALTTSTVAPPATVTIAPEQPPVVAAPAAPPPAAALSPVTPRGGGRERYDEIARQYAANPSGNFTIQIQILCDPANLEKAIRAGGENVWFVPQTLGGRSCYRVFWGRYGTREEAQRALAGIPASVRDRSSAVKPVPR